MNSAGWGRARPLLRTRRHRSPRGAGNGSVSSQGHPGAWECAEAPQGTQRQPQGHGGAASASLGRPWVSISLPHTGLRPPVPGQLSHGRVEEGAEWLAPGPQVPEPVSSSIVLGNRACSADLPVGPEGPELTGEQWLFVQSGLSLGTTSCRKSSLSGWTVPSLGPISHHCLGRPPGEGVRGTCRKLGTLQGQGRGRPVPL